MTASARPARARRGRTLVIGQSPALNGVAAQLARPPLFARTFLDAIGQVAVAPAAEPISTVVICLQNGSIPAGPAIKALRKLDPSLRIVLLASSHAAIRDVEDAGKSFDECILPPLKPGDLARLFEDDALATHAQEPTEQASATAVAPSPLPTANILTLTEDDSPENAPDGREDGVKTPAPPASEMRATHSSSSSLPSSSPQNLKVDPQPIDDLTADIAGRFTDDQTAMNPEAAEPLLDDTNLGDTDLVEAVLSRAGVRELALRIISQQTGWRDLALSADDGQNPPSSSSASSTVAFNGQSFGRLASRIASQDDLRPWAQWLARWLALDRLHAELHVQAMQDDLTGAWNRRFFDAFLKDAIHEAGKARRLVSVMVFDIDNFKTYNDQFGHAAGDQVLRETVRMLQSMIRQGDRVCRIGGDEFAVIFADPEAPRAAGSTHPSSVQALAQRFQDAVCSMRFPKLGIQAPGNLSISAGLASYPWDGADPETILRRADELALESKRKGKNAITFGPAAHRG